MTVEQYHEINNDDKRTMMYVSINIILRQYVTDEENERILNDIARQYDNTVNNMLIEENTAAILIGKRDEIVLQRIPDPQNVFTAQQIIFMRKCCGMKI